MKIKTSELQGVQLDYAVAMCEGRGYVTDDTEFATDGKTYRRGTFQVSGPHYSTRWAQGGPIIERERLGVWAYAPAWSSAPASFTEADPDTDGFYGMPAPLQGDTPLIAAMRCYVASKLGDEVEVPDELTRG